MSAKEMTDDVSAFWGTENSYPGRSSQEKKKERKGVEEVKAFRGREEKQSHLRVEWFIVHK